MRPPPLIKQSMIQAEGASDVELRSSANTDAAMTTDGADDPLVESDQTSTQRDDPTSKTNTNDDANDAAGLECEGTAATTAAATTTTTTVTPPPANGDQPATNIIPPGLMPSDQGAETALSWLRRSEASLAALNQTPTDEEYLLGADFRDVCVQEFWGGGGAGTAAASLACCGNGANGESSILMVHQQQHNRGTPADGALARHEMMERRRRKWRNARNDEDVEKNVTLGSNKRRRGGNAASSGTNGDGREEAEQEAPSSIPPILSSIRRGCGLSFVDLALLQPATKMNNKLAGSSNSNGGNSRQYPAMEVRGQPGTGKTRLMLTLAANYIASTSVGCYLDVERVISDSLESSSGRRRSRNGCGGNSNANGNGNAGHMCDEEEQPNATGGDDPLLPLSQDSTGIIADTDANTAIGNANANTNASNGRDDNDAWAAYGLGVPSVISRGNNDDNNDKSSQKKSKKKPIITAASPSVVILDSDLNIHPTALVAAVRAAVLRRWGGTTDVRQLLEEKRTRSNDDDIGGALDSTGPTPNAKANDEEWRRIQSEIYSALSRIHIVKTNSGEGLFADAIPVLESLRHSLDLAAEQCDLVGSSTTSGGFGGGNRPSSAAPPTLLIIDTLTSSERRSQRLEALGSGLSGQNDFYRQLSRLRAAHPVAVVGTSTGTASMVAGIGNAGGTGGRDSNLWSKMVTARVGLDRNDATAENASSSSGVGGYDYQALVPCTATSTVGGGAGGSLVATVPFKIDSSGIWD